MHVQSRIPLIDLIDSTYRTSGGSLHPNFAELTRSAAQEQGGWKDARGGELRGQNLFAAFLSGSHRLKHARAGLRKQATKEGL
mmetsp:Transcript_58425/g.135975  ORF Transcript_58425/g.135975 Transcript_58425/m.135975 type:complete len:83 (-) Transcript_58425:23-271(-)